MDPLGFTSDAKSFVYFWEVSDQSETSDVAQEFKDVYLNNIVLEIDLT